MSMDAAPRVWLFADYNQAESRLVAAKGPVPKLKRWYAEGVDVHAHVCQLIARVVQENKVATPGSLFKTKPWSEYRKGDEEREVSKRCVHAYNYGMGADKMALVCNITVEFATVLLKVYGTLFPEIKTGYHAWVEDCLRKTRTIVMPEPVRFRKVFWDDVKKPEVIRSAYSCYPQCTIGSMLKRTVAITSKIFLEDEDGKYESHWRSWYGEGNWPTWRARRKQGLRDPQTIIWSGFDIRLNVHDAGGISVPNDPGLIDWVARTWKGIAETPIHISQNEAVVIPVDFQIGTTWGHDDLKPYHIA